MQNIFHGGMSLDQLYFARPAPSYSGYRSPVAGLYLCGSGAHPGEQGWELGKPQGAAGGGQGAWMRTRGAQGVSSAALSPGGETEQPPWCSPRCWGHCSLFLPCRRRCDGSSGTQCSPGGSRGLQAPETAAVTPTSPPWGCGCSEPCCPQAEPAVPTLLPTTAAGQALAAAPLVHVGQAAGTRADPVPSPPHALGIVAPTEINTARGSSFGALPMVFQLSERGSLVLGCEHRAHPVSP